MTPAPDHYYAGTHHPNSCPACRTIVPKVPKGGPHGPHCRFHFIPALQYVRVNAFGDSQTLQCCLQDASCGSADGRPDGSRMSIAELAEPATSVAGSVTSATVPEQQKPPLDMPCSAAQLAMLTQGPRMPGPHVFVFKLLGTVCQPSLQDAINMMVREHEALRTHIVQPDATKPWQRITSGAALEAAVYQHPDQLADICSTEAGSMPGWIRAIVADLQQLVMKLDKAPLAAVQIYEVCLRFSHTKRSIGGTLQASVVQCTCRCQGLQELLGWLGCGVGFFIQQAMMAAVLQSIQRRFVCGIVPEPIAVASAALACSDRSHPRQGCLNLTRTARCAFPLWLHMACMQYAAMIQAARGLTSAKLQCYWHVLQTVVHTQSACSCTWRVSHQKPF